MPRHNSFYPGYILKVIVGRPCDCHSVAAEIQVWVHDYSVWVLLIRSDVARMCLCGYTRVLPLLVKFPVLGKCPLWTHTIMWGITESLRGADRWIFWRGKKVKMWKLTLNINTTYKGNPLKHDQCRLSLVKSSILNAAYGIHVYTQSYCRSQCNSRINTGKGTGLKLHSQLTGKPSPESNDTSLMSPWVGIKR